MILDANILLYAVDSTSPHHRAAASWFITQLRGSRRVGLPWQTIGAFIRIASHPRIMTTPLTGAQAWHMVESWLDAEPTWVPPATERTARIYGELVGATEVTGNLVPDAQLAALAIELGVEVVSADTDFARFTGVRWVNPL